MEEIMYAYKCSACGELHHPRHYVCRACGGRSFEKIPLNGEGTLVTYTKVYNLPEGYMKPYIYFGIVKFENGVTVSGQLEVKNPEIGMRVKSTAGIVKKTENVTKTGFIFVDCK